MFFIRMTSSVITQETLWLAPGPSVHLLFARVLRKQHVASFTPSLCLSSTFCLQVRSLTSARCVEKPLVRAPTSSPTVGSTQASSPLAVTCVAKASNERWIYGDTGKHSMAWNEFQLQYGKHLQHYENRLPWLSHWTQARPKHRPWHYLSDQELGEKWTGPGIDRSTWMTVKAEIKRWGLFLPSSVSEITLENKPVRYEAWYSKDG